MNPSTSRVLKIVLGAVFVFAGSVFAIRMFPSPNPVVLPSSHIMPTHVMPGTSAAGECTLPWSVFTQYFKFLLLCLALANLGAVLIYAGLTGQSRPATGA